MTPMARFLSENALNKVSTDLSFLTKAVLESNGELDLQIRPDDRLNIYYQGNSLAEIAIRSNDYAIKVHYKFGLSEAIEKLQPNIMSKLNITNQGNYQTVNVPPDLIHPCLQLSVRRRLISKIKEVNNGEEISFEQSLMTDNIGREELIIIDRQVTGGGIKGIIDLLALKISKDGRYSFLIIEVKLGNNKELNGPIVDQLDRYTEAIRDNIQSFIKCYETNYSQKIKLGLLPTDWKDTIEITEKVEGEIVVGHYSKIGTKAIETLKSNHTDMPYKIEQFKNIISV